MCAPKVTGVGVGPQLAVCSVWSRPRALYEHTGTILPVEISLDLSQSIEQYVIPLTTDTVLTAGRALRISTRNTLLSMVLDQSEQPPD